MPYDAVYCRNSRCNNHFYFDNLENLAEDLISAINSAAKDNLAIIHNKNTKKKVIYPGWKTMVEPFKEQAEFWNFLWLEAGKPNLGEIFSIMKHTKSQYHYAVRRCKKAALKLKEDKMVECLLNGDTDLFNEVRKSRSSRKECATTIDGQLGAENISNHFRQQYETLYNQQKSEQDMKSILNDLNNSIHDSDIMAVNSITENLVKDIIQSKIKPSKADALEYFNSDCLRNGPEELFQCVALLFQGLAVHGVMPDIMLYCAIIPIVKDPSGSLESSSNYRGIAISSLFLKIWDWIIIMLYGDALSSDELQFGFQRHSSTTLCTWSVIETINYYKRGGSEVYCCLLDCKKAFDTVEHSKIFNKLCNKIPLIFVRILLVTYLGQRCFVRWNSKDSNTFSVQNGVRQGAVLSPILFSLYVNDLIDILRASGLGCYVANKFFGIVAYADDILLLAPKRHVLQKMVDISESYMIDHKINFSPQKTKCLCFGANSLTVKNICVSGTEIEWSAQAVHLGVTLCSDGKLDQDVKVKRAQFIEGCHYLLDEFRGSHPEVQAKLLILYNSSCYGSNLWDLFGDWCRKLWTSWNIDLREIWKLPYETHRYFYEHLTECRHLKVLLSKRFLTFVNSIVSGSKQSCKLLLRLNARNCDSPTGKNIRNIELESNLHVALDSTKGMISQICKNLHFEESPKNFDWKISLMKELSLLKSGHLVVENFEENDLTSMLKFICCS